MWRLTDTTINVPRSQNDWGRVFKGGLRAVQRYTSEIVMWSPPTSQETSFLGGKTYLRPLLDHKLELDRLVISLSGRHQGCYGLLRLVAPKEIEVDWGLAREFQAASDLVEFLNVETKARVTKIAIGPVKAEASFSSFPHADPYGRPTQARAVAACRALEEVAIRLDVKETKAAFDRTLASWCGYLVGSTREQEALKKDWERVLVVEEMQEVSKVSSISLKR